MTHRSKRKRHNKRVKTKRRILTDKERQAADREHWDLNHGMPEILGHNAEQTTQSNTTMTPINFQSLLDYHDNETMHHDNLKNFSDLLDNTSP